MTMRPATERVLVACLDTAVGCVTAAAIAYFVGETVEQQQFLFLAGMATNILYRLNTKEK